MDLVAGSVGVLAYDVAFSAGKLNVSLGDSALGVSSSIAVDEKLVLAALLKLIPVGGTFATIAGMAISIVESATAAL